MKSILKSLNPVITFENYFLIRQKPRFRNLERQHVKEY